MKRHPQELETSYPYRGKTGRCHYKSSHGVVTAESYVHVPARSVSALMEALEVQPVCVSVDAGGKYFQSYRSGILNTTKCGSDLDHAVTAVGYGVESGQKFVIVRNSWTASWGE